MTTKFDFISHLTLAELGFSPFFQSQLSLDDLEQLQPMRVVDLQRDRLNALSESGMSELSLGADMSTAEVAVGDWVLVDAQCRVNRLLSPKSSLHRRAAGTNVAVQAIANNVDTLFIVTSCNADFNAARLERYLALSKEADVDAVILLTKADLSDRVEQLQHSAQALMANLIVLPINATDSHDIASLRPWCSEGQTVALVGSSGVGKTTILNALTGESAITQDIRHADEKGKHTTTYRSMHRIKNGGWVIDTPGMRELKLHDSADGITAVFEEITQAASYCKFTDCRHESEPGCAVKRAIDNGELDAERLKRWRKLQKEDNYNTQSIAESRERDRQFGKSVNRAIRGKNKRNGR